MGLFRRKDERAIPKPGSKEFEEAVRGAPAERPEQPEPVTDGGPAAEQPEQPAEEPEIETVQADDEADERGRGKRALGALGRSILKPPNTEGFGGGVSGAPPKRKPKE